MQRLVSCIRSVSLTDISGVNSCSIIGCSAWNLQFVRWRKKPRRKPFWLGRAKSKLLTFENYPPMTPEALETVKIRMDEYREDMAHLYNHFKMEFERTSETSEIGMQKAEAEKREHERLMEENRLENERVAKLREERAANELKSKRDYFQQKYDAFAEEERIRLEEADRIIRFYKSLPVINAENLNDAVDKALEAEIDYNYAIDLQGNVFKGRRTKPETIHRNYEETQSEII